MDTKACRLVGVILSAGIYQKIVKRDAFKGMPFASAKKYKCEKGRLTLTSKGILIECEHHWSKLLPISRFCFEAWNDKLEVKDYYGKLRFSFIIDNPESWNEAIQNMKTRWLGRVMMDANEREQRRPAELKNLFDIEPQGLKKLYEATRKEREEYERKNIRFNLVIQGQLEKVKNRKLRAFIIAHSYVAWYEWIKKLLYKIHKAKFGKGPANDNELMKFLDGYPSLKYLLHRPEWEVRPNQIRNCVSHERFFFDYRAGELVFMTKKEQRVPLRDFRWAINPMANLYGILLRSLADKATKGEVHYEPKVL